MGRIGIWAGVALCGMVPAGAIAATTAPAAVPLTAASTSVSQTGAITGAVTQPGGWGQGGWQTGTAPAPVALAPQAADVGYHRPAVGENLAPAWLDPAYTVGDWQTWGLSQPGAGQRWVRYNDDAALIDTHGHVSDVRYGLNWQRSTAIAAGAVTSSGQTPVVTTYQTGPNTTVTRTERVGPMPVVAGAVPAPGYGPGYYLVNGSVVTMTPGRIITTKTTTITNPPPAYQAGAVKRRAPHRVAHHRRKPSCACGR